MEKVVEYVLPKGYVHWELIDEKTGKITHHGVGTAEINWVKYAERILPKFLKRFLPLGDENAILNFARNKFADFFIGTSVTPPEYIGIGTGTGNVAASDTALDTLTHYDGVNDAKIASSKTLLGLYTSRIVTQFSTTEAVQSIRQLGLFDAANSGNLWAKVKVTINKANTERLNVYWYILWERRVGVAIKTGASIGATGTTVANTDSTLTFASAVTIVTIHNNTGIRAYFKLNEALTGDPPTNFDFLLEDGDSMTQSDEEIEISTIHVYLDDGIVMPNNKLTARGW